MNMKPGIAALARQGRGGDSTLVHMRPDEVAAMQRLARQYGTSMTINPQTGLPEAFKLKDLFNINTYTKPIRRAAESVGLGGVSDAISGGFKTLGQNAQYILPFVPGSMFAGLGGVGQFAASPMGRGLLAGGIGALQGGRGSLRRGLLSGLTAYGLSSAYQGLQAAGGLGGSTPAPGPVDLTGAEGSIDPAAFERAMAPEGIMLSDTGAGSAVAGPPATVGAGSVRPPVTAAAAKPGFMGEVKAAASGLKNLATGDKEAMKAFTDKFGRGTAGVTYMGVTGMMAINEQEKLIDQALAEQRISEAEHAKYKARIAAAKKRAEEAVKANPYKFNVGGEIDDQYQLMTPNLGGKGPSERNVFGLAAGGMPRYLNGKGDGMSDSIPARIGGVQEARLADGEFVVPADVVSHLGNGSSNAGAKQLYAMMDRVRQQRTGTKQQGKEITPTKMMPA